MQLIVDKNKNINKNKNIEFAAYQMIAAGYHLLPLKEGDKIPEFDLLLGGKTKPYQENQASFNIVKNWFDDTKDINFGVFAGTKIDDSYSLIIVDLDKKPDFGLPMTPIVETARGYHLYFKCKTDNLPNAFKSARGEIKVNGYVVAPPSKHPSGKVYKWSEYLSFKDIPLANFEERKEQIIDFLKPKSQQAKNTSYERDYNKEKDYVPTININSGYKALSDFKITTAIQVNKSNIIELSKSSEICLEIMDRLFDIKPKRVGASFNCPLHKEKKPSAALYRTDNGTIGFKDFHRSGSFYTMPELYFEFITGKQKNLRGATAIIWWLRMLVDCKLIKVPTILPPKPTKELSEKEKSLYKGFIKLLEVQQVYNPNQTAAPFSRTFAADWTGINRNSIGFLKGRLVDKGYIRKVKSDNQDKRKAARWELVKGLG